MDVFNKEPGPAAGPDKGSRNAALRWRAATVLFWLAAAGAAVFLYGAEPRDRAVAPFCVFYKTTGLYCPGCGALRAGHDLLHGRLLAALDHNVFAVLALPYLLWGFSDWTIRCWRGGGGRRRYLPGWLGYTLLAVVVGFAVVRNIPLWPFSVLAP